jgi:dTMP kinase
MRSGVVISFEGTSNAGKTTALHRIEKALKEIGVPVRVKSDLFDYQGENVGAKIKDILQAGSPSFNLGLPVVETLLICAKRAFEAQTRLEPAIQGGAVILCDRDIDTVCAYQLKVLAPHRPFLSQDLIIDLLRRINSLAAPEPDLTFYLEVTQSGSWQREVSRDNSDDSQRQSFLNERERELRLFETVLDRPLVGRELHRLNTNDLDKESVFQQVMALSEHFLRFRGYKL